jgi:hypothetical protein
MEEELLPTSHSNTKLECRGQGYTATSKLSSPEEEIYTAKSWLNAGKGQNEITFFFFFYLLKTEGKI